MDHNIAMTVEGIAKQGQRIPEITSTLTEAAETLTALLVFFKAIAEPESYAVTVSRALQAAEEYHNAITDTTGMTKN